MIRLSRLRLAALLVTVAVMIGGAATYLATRLAEQQRIRTAEPDPERVVSLASLAGEPRILFRSTALDSTYGRLSAVPLDDPRGPRATTDLACERVYATDTTGICLAADRGVITTYEALAFDADLDVVDARPLTGLPSRTRLSDDGRLVATTTFVTGHSYAAAGFSTETVVRDLDGTVHGNLEDFTLLVEGRELTAVDRNFWGVTFAGDDEFYATAASGGRTWLVRGSLSDRRMEALREDAECPSLSPDRTRLVYKKREGATAGTWRLALYDLATGQESVLREARSVDDQVVWLDDSRIAYGLPREGADAAVTDVWVLDVDQAEPPQILVPQAWSPTVVGT